MKRDWFTAAIVTVNPLRNALLQCRSCNETAAYACIHFRAWSAAPAPIAPALSMSGEP
jgi:hypothetical protein